MIFRKCKTGSPGRAGPDARSVQGELPKWSPADLQSSERRGGTKGNREGQRDTAATGDTPVQRGEDARSTKERSGKSEIKTPPPDGVNGRLDAMEDTAVSLEGATLEATEKES